jgi:hypothetical protein
MFGKKENLSLFNNNDELYKIIEPLNKNTKYIYLLYELLVNTKLIKHLITEKSKFNYNTNHHYSFHNKQKNNNYCIIYSIYEDYNLIGVVDESVIETEKYDGGFSFKNINEYFKYDYDFTNHKYYIEFLVFRSGLLDITDLTIDEEKLQITKEINYLKDSFLPILIKQLETTIGQKFNKMDEQNINEQWTGIIDQINRIEGSLTYEDSNKYILDIIEWIINFINYLNIKTTSPLYKIDHDEKYNDFTIDWSISNIHVFKIIVDIEIDFINPSYPQILRLVVEHDNEVHRNIIFQSLNIKWKDGIIPILTDHPDRVDVYEFFYDGSTYYGKLVDSYI